MNPASNRADCFPLSLYFLVGTVRQTIPRRVLGFLFFFLLSSRSLSLWYFPLPQFYPAGMAGDFTPNWLSRRPLLEPFSRSTSGRRDLGCEWRFVYCFSKRGPLSPALICHRSLSVAAPQCLIVPAKSPGFRPDLCNTLLPNSDPSFRFSSAHKGIVSYCPRFRGGTQPVVHQLQFV